MKHIKKGQEARELLAKGIEFLESVVASTLGPDGKIVFFERPQGPPIGTKDGVTAAHLTFLENEFENMGADLIKLAAAKTAEDAGDGTTTSTILANYMIQQGIKQLANGSNARFIAEGIKMATDVAIAQIKKGGKKINQKHPLVKDVALVSSNYDKVVAEMITEVIKDIGKDGVIKIIQSMGEETTMSYEKGMYLNSSFIHPAFINNPARNEVVLRSVAIIVTDYEISSADDVQNMYVPLYQHGGVKRQLKDGTTFEKKVNGWLFMGKDCIGEGLQTMLKSRVEKDAPFCAVRPPWGDQFVDVMEDVCVVTGGTLIAESKGFALDKAKAHKVVGWAKEVVVSAKGMTITGGAGTKEDVAKRIEYIDNRIKEEDNTTRKNKLKERKARMQQGIAQIKVGGPNEPLMRERAYRVEDAKEAVRAALEEGVTVGGGVSFIRAIAALDDIKTDNPEQEIGINIVRGALKTPIKAILVNSGYSDDERSRMIAKVEDGNGNEGFNAKTKKFEDLFKAGIINPVKVDTKAIENASEVTRQFLNMGAVIALLRDDGQISSNAPQR